MKRDFNIGLGLRAGIGLILGLFVVGLLISAAVLIADNYTSDIGLTLTAADPAAQERQGVR